MKKILVYTDGSCIGNPGPGGWAFLLVEGDKAPLQKIIYHDSGYDFATTNNRMEMTAFLQAIKYLAKNYSSQQVQIFSDSNLLVQSINLGWKRKANLDIWGEIDLYIDKINYQFNWVKAHHVDQFNNECDRLAQSASQSALKKMSSKTFVPPVIQTSEAKSGTTKKPARNQSGQASLF